MPTGTRGHPGGVVAQLVPQKDKGQGHVNMQSLVDKASVQRTIEESLKFAHL